jgi:hypothetical protein
MYKRFSLVGFVHTNTLTHKNPNPKPQTQTQTQTETETETHMHARIDACTPMLIYAVNLPMTTSHLLQYS